MIPKIVSKKNVAKKNPAKAGFNDRKCEFYYLLNTSVYDPERSKVLVTSVPVGTSKDSVRLLLLMLAEADPKTAPEIATLPLEGLVADSV